MRSPCSQSSMMLHGDAGELAAAERAGEADQQQGAVAQAWEVVPDRRDDLAQEGDLRGELGPRPVAEFARGPVQPGEGLAVEFPSTFQLVPLALQ